MHHIRDALGAYEPEIAISVSDILPSTNTAAKADAPLAASTALYVANAQTEGRGRLGRSFHSPADTGLYMTVAYTTDEPLTEAVRVTALAAVAALSAIEALTDKRPAIKWVNDLYLNGCKIGGILTEAVTLSGGQSRMIVGWGINLTTASFPEGLRAPADCLFPPAEAHLATPSLRNRLAGEITRRLLEALDGTHAPADCLRIYREHLLYVGDRVLCTRGSERFEGTVLGVDDGYSLLIATEAQTVLLSSGEISVRPLKKS